MLTIAGLERVLLVGQLYIKRDSEINILLLVAKVTQDFLMTYSIETITHLINQLHAELEFSNEFVDKPVL